jgi:hypothetical protein
MGQRSYTALRAFNPRRDWCQTLVERLTDCNTFSRVLHFNLVALIVGLTTARLGTWCRRVLEQGVLEAHRGRVVVQRTESSRATLSSVREVPRTTRSDSKKGNHNTDGNADD